MVEVWLSHTNGILPAVSIQELYTSVMGSDLPSYHVRGCICPKLSLAWSECLRVLLESVSMGMKKQCGQCSMNEHLFIIVVVPWIDEIVECIY
jgi:hypothetical protein